MHPDQYSELFIFTVDVFTFTMVVLICWVVK